MSKPHPNLPFDSGNTVGSVVLIRSEAWMFLLCLRPRPQSHRNVNCNFFTCSKVSGWLHRKRQHFTCSKVSGWLRRKLQHSTCSKVSGWLRRILQHFTCSKVSGCARGGFGGRGRFSRNPASYSGAPGGWPPNAAGRTGRVRVVDCVSGLEMLIHAGEQCVHR